MNPEKVEKIYRRLHPRRLSGFDFVGQAKAMSVVAWTQNGLAILWGTAYALKLANAGCYAWATSFWYWAMACYHWSGFESSTPEERKRLLEGDKHYETRLFIFAFLMATHGCEEPWHYCCDICDIPGFGSFNALSTDELKFIEDSLRRGVDPRKLLNPNCPNRPNRNPKTISLQTAAQTITRYASKKY